MLNLLFKIESIVGGWISTVDFKISTDTSTTGVALELSRFIITSLARSPVANLKENHSLVIKVWLILCTLGWFYVFLGYRLYSRN